MTIKSQDARPHLYVCETAGCNWQGRTLAATYKPGDHVSFLSNGRGGTIEGLTCPGCGKLMELVVSMEKTT